MNEYFDLLGRTAKDRITGFKGVVSTVAFDLYGCVTVALTPAADTKSGKLGDGHWFDAKRVKITDKERVMDPPRYADLEMGAEIGAAEKPAMAGMAG